MSNYANSFTVDEFGPKLNELCLTNRIEKFRVNAIRVSIESPENQLSIRRQIYHIAIYPIIMNTNFRMPHYHTHFIHYLNPVRTRSINFVRDRFWCRLKAQIQGFRSAPKSFSYEYYRPCSHRFRKNNYVCMRTKYLTQKY